MRNKVYKESGYSFQPIVNQEANQKFVHSKHDVITRNKEFIEKKQNNIKLIESQTKCDFKPSRVTKQSKLAKEWEKEEDLDPKQLGDKLFQKQSEIESKKEVLRQKLSKDENCTF